MRPLGVLTGAVNLRDRAVKEEDDLEEDGRPPDEEEDETMGLTDLPSMARDGWVGPRRR